MRQGMEQAAAIPQAVRTRIRPIFMTTLTTFFGQLLLVIRPGSGAELYRGVGAVVLGGLLVSTVFTLLVVPAVLSLFMSAKLRFGRMVFGRQRYGAFESAPLGSAVPGA
jgi:HAE1 family hydrophobic/amphiphilic exporter-1